MKSSTKSTLVGALFALAIIVFTFFITGPRYGTTKANVPTAAKAVVYKDGSVTTIDDRTIMTYALYNGRQVQMVFEPANKEHKSSLVMRIKVSEDANENPPSYFPSGDDMLNYMKTWVEEAVRTRQPMKLGTSGYSVQFCDGYPIWGPHWEMYQEEGDFDALYFAENVTPVGRTFVVHGSRVKGPYFPYRIPERL